MLNLNSVTNFITPDLFFNNRMNEFISLVQSSLSNELFKTVIREYIEFIIQTNLQQNSLYPTMRMTCLQIY